MIQIIVRQTSPTGRGGERCCGGRETILDFELHLFFPHIASMWNKTSSEIPLMVVSIGLP